MHRPIAVAITGGIGAGKSTALDAFRAHGAATVSSDEIVHHLLGLIVNTIQDFRYRREWQSGRELALEFTGRVGELELQGIDLISLDERHRIQRLDVMIRPLNAVVALREAIAPQMASFLAERARAGRGA